MAEILEGKRPFFETRGGETNIVLLSSFYEIKGFHLKAYNEFESYFDDPEPYLELDLTSAAVFARVKKGNSILLVEFESDNGRRIELPAGKVDEKVDETIIDTASREFAEETGGKIALGDLIPFLVSQHRDGKGGLQFYTEIPKLKTKKLDQFGRRYLIPPEGTDKGRVKQLITEPLNVFLDPKETLLRHSQNQWAVDEVTRLSIGMLIARLNTKRK